LVSTPNVTSVVPTAIATTGVGRGVGAFEAWPGFEISSETGESAAVLTGTHVPAFPAASFPHWALLVHVLPGNAPPEHILPVMVTTRRTPRVMACSSL
jgi:hypothetical protein